jgi:hypothetical protein
VKKQSRVEGRRKKRRVKGGEREREREREREGQRKKEWKRSNRTNARFHFVLARAEKEIVKESNPLEPAFAG